VLGGLPQRAIESGIRESHLSLADVLNGEDIWGWQPARVRGFYDFSRLLVHRLALGQLAGRSDWRAGLESFLAGEHDSLPGALGLSSVAMERRLIRYLDHPASVDPSVRVPEDESLLLRCLDASETVVQVSQAIVHHHPDYAERALRRRLKMDADNADLWRALSVAEEMGDALAGGGAAAARLPAPGPYPPGGHLHAGAGLSVFRARRGCAQLSAHRPPASALGTPRELLSGRVVPADR